MDLLDSLGKLLHGGNWCYLYNMECEDEDDDFFEGCSIKKRDCKWYASNYRSSRKKVKNNV